jgi:hypothetical protein
MATSGRDGIVKVWDCRNWKGSVREWNARGGAAEVEWSAKGTLAVASGGTVNVRLSYFSTIFHFTDYGLLAILSTNDLQHRQRQ